MTTAPAEQSVPLHALRLSPKNTRQRRDPDTIRELLAERDQLAAENARLREALRDAATSMQTIADKAGRDEYLMTTDEVRGYANSRANAARAALDQEGGNG